MSDKPGLVDMAIRQMNCGFNLPDGQANFFLGGGGGNSNYTLKHCMANFFMKFLFIKNCF